MKKSVKKDAYLPWSHVQLEKNVKWSRHPGMLGFMGKISNSLIMELLQLWVLKSKYRQSRSISWLVAHPRIFRLFMKGKFDAYLLWPLAKRFQSFIVARFTVCDYIYCMLIFGQKSFSLGPTIIEIPLLDNVDMYNIDFQIP